MTKAKDDNCGVKSGGAGKPSQNGRKKSTHTEQKNFNLFVYGTLMDPIVFRAVLGKRLISDQRSADGVNVFHADRAVLGGYKKISPDNTYLYAVPDKGHRTNGYIIRDLPPESLPALKTYEGNNYSRKRVKVQTSRGSEEAVVFIGKIKQLEHAFGHTFRDALKQEILLEKKIDNAIREAELKQLHTDEDLLRKAVAELSGSKIRDIIRTHFEGGGISDYAIRHSLTDTPLPDYAPLRDDPAMKALAPYYLKMVIRQVVFNQFEERIRREFRYELDHLPQLEAVYERVPSSLVALRILNQNRTVLDVVVADSLGGLDFQSSHLVDDVRHAIAASDALYDPKPIKAHLDFVREHMGFGHMPLGAELEFSNIGHEVIRDPQAHSVTDRIYDGFIYFDTFGLDKLTWKLGGHIDDHHRKTPGVPRRGFFEVALGNISIEANISKPITRDPWILNQLIHQTLQFYDVTPHSVHLSMQLRSQHRPDRDRALPLSVLKCLFAIGGDPIKSEDGSLRIRRLSTGEILRLKPKPNLLFSEISKRFSSGSEPYLPAVRQKSSGVYVQQFRFLRLSRKLNYEAIAMGLKGIQISLRPGTFMTGSQWEQNRKHHDLFEGLLEWGNNPTAISEADIEEFLGHVQDGLMKERRGKPAHDPAYIAWSISQLKTSLNEFNKAFKESGTAI